MPLQVKGFLNRPRAIFLAGEVITVKVIIKNTSKKNIENIAWGSVQLVSERTFGAQSIISERPATAISKSPSTVYSSLPLILFCDLNIGPGEQKQFKTDISIPETIPPSFKGYFVKYLSKISIAVQHVRDPIKVMHIPVRIIPSVTLDIKQSQNANPFVAPPNNTLSELVSSAVDQMTAPRKPLNFCMTNSDGKVTFLTLFKKVFRLGEEIVGHLDFRDADVNCVQYSVDLETVESLPESDRVDEDDEEFEMRKSSRSKTTVLASCQDVCAYTKDSAFRLCIPMHANPTFFTDNVHFKWRLRFEFVTSKNLIEANLYGLSSAPTNIEVETVSWSVDVFVLPCCPENVSLTDLAYSGETGMIL
ncbi:unnamed protein product [Auanema sp. JU1783]|nr:unnamed protein product [Auanema sp. JU1783]